MTLRSAYLVVEKGSPFEKGTRVMFTNETTLLGRSTDGIAPDIAFDNFLISRKHCCIRKEGNSWYLIDLSSKHGTTLCINVRLEPHVAQKLVNGDTISLASGTAVVRFHTQKSDALTIDFTKRLELLQILERAKESSIKVDAEKMQVLVGDSKITLTCKEWQLLSILYDIPNKLVSYDEVCNAVWPERGRNAFTNQLVGVEEINVLVYRLRKKIAPFGKLLKTVRGRGFILEINEDRFKQ